MEKHEDYKEIMLKQDEVISILEIKESLVRTITFPANFSALRQD